MGMGRASGGPCGRRKLDTAPRHGSACVRSHPRSDTMEKNSSTSHRKKHDSSMKEGSEVSQSSTRTRQKRGSTSQTSVSSSVTCSEESMCNGLSTSANQTQKSRSASVLSSSEPLASGGHRRSARLSQMESQQTSEDKKKKKSDEQKTPGKDKRKGRIEQIMEEQESEKPASSKRTSGKSKKSVSGTLKKSDRVSEEEVEEPVEKKAKKSARRSKELTMQDDSSLEDKPVNNADEILKNSVVANTKPSKKRASKKQTLCEPSPSVNELNIETNIDTLTSSKHEHEKQEQPPKSSKRKKSMSSTTGNNVSEDSFKQDEGEDATNSKIPKGEERIQEEDDTMIYKNEHNKKFSDNALVTAGSEPIASNAGNESHGSAVAPCAEAQDSNMKSESSETQQHSVRGEKLIKESFPPKINTVSPSKADLVQEYNRSISEKISLLKPKAFVGRSSASFRKTADDRCDGSGQEVDSDAESRRAIMESAQRRIEQNLSTSESDSRLIRGMHTPMAHSSKNDSSESDSAPEAVSFSNARQDAMDTIKSAAEHVKREKQRLKERRKARLEMLKQQKEEKLIRLKEKMASQEDASCSSSEESGYEEEIRNARQKLKKKKAKSKAQRTEKENLDDALGQATSKPLSGAASDSTEEDGITTKEAASLSSLKRVQVDMFQSAKEAAKTQKVGSSSGNKVLQEDKLKKKKSKSGRIDEPDKKDRGFKNLTSLDYIPLSTEGATKFMVVPLDKAMRAPKSLAEEAADFRQNMLYGSRIKREPGKVVSAYQQKLIASGKNFHVR
ncbi:Uncharacterized protein GBIM_07932 [Gryllus bimaculatus]|nr:Uncharacterized protein GBIM_07932 [Gryllus bimaculatus]